MQHGMRRGGITAMIYGALALSLVASAVAEDSPGQASASGTAAVTDTEQAFDLSWWSVDGGGAVTSDGTFSLTGAIGQPDVGGSYRAYFALDAGVWSVELEPAFFYDGFENGGTDAWSAVVGGN